MRHDQLLNNLTDNPQSPVRTILVVDDQPGVRMSLDFLLKAEGYRVLTAESGREALGILGAEQVDGAIVDVHMPGMNGIDTTVALHLIASRLGRSLHVWLMTGVPTRELERRAAAAGVINIFHKPFEWPTTLATLATGFLSPPLTPLAAPGPSCVTPGDEAGGNSS